jgi:ABC-type oligopeptide transport system ATPase subunit
MRIGDAIAQPLLEHGLAKKANVREKVFELLKLCGLSDYQIDRFPHEFFGGQRQRIVRALALNPKLIIADEPVSSLDVSIQAQIINLFSDLKDEKQLSYLFISHDLSVIEHLCTRIAIMYLGNIVEIANRDELFNNPLHPYTKALLSAVPIPDSTIKKKQK